MVGSRSWDGREGSVAEGRRADVASGACGCVGILGGLGGLVGVSWHEDELGAAWWEV